MVVVYKLNKLKKIQMCGPTRRILKWRKPVFWKRKIVTNVMSTDNEKKIIMKYKRIRQSLWIPSWTLFFWDKIFELPRRTESKFTQLQAHKISTELLSSFQCTRFACLSTIRLKCCPSLQKGGKNVCCDLYSVTYRSALGDEPSYLIFVLIIKERFS